MKTILDKLEKFGFIELETSSEDFIELANQLGNPISSRIRGQIIDNLRPCGKEDAHPNSLSSLFGLNEFPYHTDGAYFRIPPKYIIMRYVDGILSPTPTRILPLLNHLKENEIVELKNENWSVTGRSISFYSSILNLTSDNKHFLRYDVGCMKSISSSNHIDKIISTKIKEGLSTNIEWYKCKTLILDNWRVVHARPKINIKETKLRTIQRIMIND